MTSTTKGIKDTDCAYPKCCGILEGAGTITEAPVAAVPSIRFCPDPDAIAPVCSMVRPMFPVHKALSEHGDEQHFMSPFGKVACKE